MAIIESDVLFDKHRRTWSIQISTPHNEVPEIIIEREVLWVESSNPENVIQEIKDANPITATGLTPEFNYSLITLCEELNLDPDVISIAQLIGALGDHFDAQVNPPS
jgi:hypothetical protein